MRTTVATVFAATLAFSTNYVVADGTHEHKHGDEAAVFDSVQNEFGMYEPDMEVTKTIEIEMSDDMKFSPDVIKVRIGDVIMFKHANKGQLLHEFVLGTRASLEEHAELMKKFPGMEHDEPYMIHVEPGKTGQMIWRFSKAGEFAFGCLVPGHYGAGMKGTVVVES